MVKEISLNECGKLITGWSSINIYKHYSLVGAPESLNDKRLRLIDQEL